MAIFNNQPQIKLNPVSISDDQGKVSLDLNVALEKDPKFDLMAGSLYKQFTDFAVNIHVDKATVFFCFIGALMFSSVIDTHIP